LSLPLAASLSALTAVLTNRILAVGVGLWFQVPAGLLLGMLLVIDIVQIPFYYRLYEHGSSLLDGVPVLNKLSRRDWSESALGKWAMPLGGFGVMLVAALPTFGGGIWSSTFLAYGLGLKRRAGYAWIVLGSALSYLTLYWILDTLFRTVRYFWH
jgi:uncharacterized membrane protein